MGNSNTIRQDEKGKRVFISTWYINLWVHFEFDFEFQNTNRCSMVVDANGTDIARRVELPKR